MERMASGRAFSTPSMTGMTRRNSSSSVTTGLWAGSVRLHARARARGLASDVEEVGAFVEQLERVRNGAFRLEELSAVGERVGRDVDHAHDERAADRVPASASEAANGREHASSDCNLRSPIRTRGPIRIRVGRRRTPVLESWHSAQPFYVPGPPCRSPRAVAPAHGAAFAADSAKTPHKKTEDDKKLSRAIEQILSEPDVARGFWGIDVVSLDTGNRLVALNENKLFTPASNTKLFTTAAVFALIGPDYRFKTTVESLGTVDKYGRLNSDLVVVGRGDPNLSGRTLPY